LLAVVCGITSISGTIGARRVPPFQTLSAVVPAWTLRSPCKTRPTRLLFRHPPSLTGSGLSHRGPGSPGQGSGIGGEGPLLLGFYSHVFLVPPKSGEYHLIIDLSHL
jgi:hypothetical protein